ncbi:Protein RTA1 [Psilocybe cubensis]|uniref:RTA1-domain-containing protein n=2 Tax=Psilocybe cubensis TaxID=181762 RepID=A0A8H7XWN2_PSICU|nr:Protein RTA1 [Psilocybe cubensis]KAH9482709.1 Protein RTA1 [Psilocybe cubensis]
MSPLRSLLLSALLSSVNGAIKHNVPRPDPFADPRHDPYNPLKYIASNTLTGIAVALVLTVGFLQTWLIIKHGARWMMSMTIGIYCLSFRFGLHVHPQSKGIYIMEYLFVVLSPCAFIAADYVLLGRLAKHLNADKHLLVPSRRITIAYVGSDITTFLIQAIGGAMSASANDPDRALAGSRVFLAGLAAQLLSFLSFSGIYLIFLWRVHKYDPDIWSMDTSKKWYNSWNALAGALSISCLGILVRSGFRVVELSEGFQGPLTTSQSLFYGLDTLPLFVAIAVYVPFWPGRFIPGDANANKE